MVRFLRVLIFSAALFALLPTAARADCDSDYSDAMDKLSKAKAQAMNPNASKLDPQAFMQDFQGDVDRMKDGGCTAQIQQLLQFVQQEATRYPAPSGSTPGGGSGMSGMPTLGSPGGNSQ